MTRGEASAAIARDEANLQEGDAIAGGIRRDADISHAGDIAAEANCRAVDGGDQRNFEIVESAHDHVDAVLVVVAHFSGAAGEGADAVAHGLDVTAGRKAFAGAGEDGAADGLVGVDLIADVFYRLTVARFAEGVHGVRTVQRQDRDGAFFSSVIMGASLQAGLEQVASD